MNTELEMHATLASQEDCDGDAPSIEIFISNSHIRIKNAEYGVISMDHKDFDMIADRLCAFRAAKTLADRAEQSL